MAEPTDEDRRKASELYWNWPSADLDAIIEIIAQALADARAEGREEAGHG